MCAAVQDGQDKDACADSFKLVCCERKIEVNALQKPFWYFLDDNRNILQVCCDSQELSLCFLLLPYPAESTPKISLCLWYKFLAKILQVHPSRAPVPGHPGLDLSILSCPQTSCKNLLCGSLRSQSIILQLLFSFFAWTAQMPFSIPGHHLSC